MVDKLQGNEAQYKELQVSGALYFGFQDAVLSLLLFPSSKSGLQYLPVYPAPDVLRCTSHVLVLHKFRHLFWGFVGRSNV